MPRFARPQPLRAPPAAVAAELDGLRAALDAAIPDRRVDRNLLIATWNLRAFGGYTDRWVPREQDSPKRSLADLAAIAEVLGRFDVIAVQEVRGDLSALRMVLRLLGEHWSVILTDVTRGDPGNNERLAFLFDLRRVRPSGLACELVVPAEELEPGALGRQFARTPYAVSFAAGAQAFTLVTLHVLWGRGPEDRLGELRVIARWLADWAAASDDFGQNLIALGDFNIYRQDDPLYRAFTEQGLRPPPELAGMARTVADLSDAPRFYDQIAWFEGKLSFAYAGRAGSFPWHHHYLADEPGVGRTFRVSDHLPLWTEFTIRAPVAVGEAPATIAMPAPALRGVVAPAPAD